VSYAQQFQQELFPSAANLDSSGFDSMPILDLATIYELFQSTPSHGGDHELYRIRLGRPFSIHTPTGATPMINRMVLLIMFQSTPTAAG